MKDANRRCGFPALPQNIAHRLSISEHYNVVQVAGTATGGLQRGGAKGQLKKHSAAWEGQASAADGEGVDRGGVQGARGNSAINPRDKPVS